MALMKRTLHKLVKWCYLLFALALILLAVVVQSGRSLSHVLGDYNEGIASYLSGKLKALAVTGGVLLTLPQHEMVLSVIVFLLLAFLFVQGDAWRVMFGLSASRTRSNMKRFIALGHTRRCPCRKGRCIVGFEGYCLGIVGDRPCEVIQSHPHISSHFIGGRVLPVQGDRPL